MDRRSAPIMTLSLAFSKSSIVTKRRFDARGHQRRLVHEVGEIGAREAGRAAGDDAQVDIGAQRHLAGMHAEDLSRPRMSGFGTCT
jgi:hypothetical protein